MNRIFCIIAAIAVSILVLNAKEYNYTSVQGDVTGTRIYTLKNGLKVYLSVNKERPRISSLIAVGTGSRNDPAETTGLAHYLEHLMFKGTRQFGTTDYRKEEVLLNDIEARYEQYRKVTDPATRTRLYHEIDSVSQLAAQYNIPNEYDKLMAAIGGQGSNAYTSNDVTCYTEDIPANEVENWARIQSDRFMNMVIRGFHTELEAVYEEYNIGLAKDQWKMYDALYAKLFPGHPYGTQTTIGTQEHLKNPSITNIKNYYNNYYCPNNVAICLAGDMDPDKVMPIIDKYFGSWKANPSCSRPEYPALKPIAAPSDTTVTGQEAEFAVMAWRFGRGNSLQCDTVEVIADMLANGTAGIFDLNLNQTMKVQSATAFPDALNDYSSLVVMAEPNDGQSLQDVRKLVLDEIAKLRNGDFDDNLLAAVVNNKKLQFLNSLDDNRSRTNMMVDAFINGKKWDDVTNKLSRMEGMTKKQIVDFAQRHIKDNNFVCVNKVQGEDTIAKKIDKPAITPIPSNRDFQSKFVADVIASKPEPIQPQFVDFNKDLTKVDGKQPILYKQNTNNDLFFLTYQFPFGYSADKRYDIAIDYLNFLGTNKMSAEDFKKALYSLACDYELKITEENIYVNIYGLNKNMPAALKLIEDLMHNAKADNEAYSSLVDMVMKMRADAKTNQEQCSAHLRTYGIYGPRNVYTDILTEQQLRDIKPEQLLDLLKNLNAQPHTVLYYGPMALNDLQSCLAANHDTSGKVRERLHNRPYIAQDTPITEVWLAPYDAKNIYMTQYCNLARRWKPENAATIELFNEYFGAGMNTIVFQELREARGLAYHASAMYSQPSVRGRSEYATTYIITQNDKMMDCINQFKCIIDTLPQSEKAFNLAKESLLKQLASRRVTKMGVLNTYINAQRRGLDYDIYQKVYEDLQGLTLNDLVNFEQTTMARKPYRYLILGDEKELDMKSLGKIAPVRRITLEDIFGY